MPKRIARLEVRAFSERLYHVLGKDPTVEILGDIFQFTEGPVWNSTNESLLFTNIPASRIYQWTERNAFSVFRHFTNMANGLAYDRDGRLLACEHATNALVRIESNGHRVVLASSYDGKQLNSPNDVVVANDGRIFFTDPMYGRMAGEWGIERPAELSFRGVYVLDPILADLTLVADDFDAPNGLCLSRDERVLFVNDSERLHIRVFDVHEDGRVVGGKVWAKTEGKDEGSPDGMKIDVEGNVYCCGPGGIHVFDECAKCLGIILLPPIVANFTFGGRNLSDLFVTATNRVYRIGVGIPGWVQP